MTDQSIDSDWRPIATAPHDGTGIAGRFLGGAVRLIRWHMPPDPNAAGWCGAWGHRNPQHDGIGWLMFNDEHQPVEWQPWNAEADRLSRMI